MAEHYDVIIIGTGAGRRHARAHARAVRASRSCCSSAATSCRARWRTGTRSRSSSTAATSRRTRGTTPTASRSSRRCTTSSAARPSCTAPRCTACARRTSASCKHVDGISPAWPLTYDDFEPYYTKAEWLYQVHGNHGEDPTEGHWSKQYPWPAVSHEPRIQQLVDDLAAAGYHPFHAPCGILLDEADRAEEHVHPLHVVRRLPVPRAREVRRRDDRRAPDRSTTPNVTLLVDAEVAQLETDASGRTVTERRRRARRRARDVRGRRRRRLGRARRTAPRSCCASANDQHPNGLANGSDQVGRNYMFHNSKAVVALSKEPQRHGLPEDARPQRLLLRRRRLRVPGRQHPDGRQVERRGDEGRGAEAHEARAALEPRRRRRSHAVDFWLTTEDLPMPENRVTLDGRRQRPPRVHSRRTTTRPTGSTTSSRRS